VQQRVTCADLRPLVLVFEAEKEGKYLDNNPVKAAILSAGVKESFEEGLVIVIYKGLVIVMLN
jgi:hypothetical protein